MDVFLVCLTAPPPLIMGVRLCVATKMSEVDELCKRLTEGAMRKQSRISEDDAAHRSASERV